MGKFIDLTDEKFGRLTILERAENHGRHVQWLCECECENRTKVTVIGTSLKSGSTKSCGCLQREIPEKHGLSKSRIYRIYHGMKTRCYNSNEPKYNNYGGRGIKICDEWLGENGFINFYNWAMNNEYNDSLTIDRIQSDGDYDPSNCRWATYQIQNNNRRNNRFLTINGITKTITTWAEIHALSVPVIRNRINHGWSDEDLFRPVQSAMYNSMADITGGNNVTKFTMLRSFEGEHKIDTNDLLTAVKMSLNYESDLYMDGRLITSWLGLPMEENVEMLYEYGITGYISKGRWIFKYTEESKNIKKYYTLSSAYLWEGTPKVQTLIHDYRTNKNEKEYDSLADIFDELKLNYSNVGLENINITEFNDDGCTIHQLQEVKTMNNYDIEQCIGENVKTPLGVGRLYDISYLKEVGYVEADYSYLIEVPFDQIEPV